MTWNLEKLITPALARIHSGHAGFLPMRSPNDTTTKFASTEDEANDEIWLHIPDQYATEEYLGADDFANLEDELPAELQPQEDV